MGCLLVIVNACIIGPGGYKQTHGPGVALRATNTWLLTEPIAFCGIPSGARLIPAINTWSRELHPGATNTWLLTEPIAFCEIPSGTGLSPATNTWLLAEPIAFCGIPPGARLIPATNIWSQVAVRATNTWLLAEPIAFCGIPPGARLILAINTWSPELHPAPQTHPYSGRSNKSPRHT
jgi:hypothetical protein